MYFKICTRFGTNRFMITNLRSKSHLTSFTLRLRPEGLDMTGKESLGTLYATSRSRQLVGMSLAALALLVLSLRLVSGHQHSIDAMQRSRGSVIRFIHISLKSFRKRGVFASAAVRPVPHNPCQEIRATCSMHASALKFVTLVPAKLITPITRCTANPPKDPKALLMSMIMQSRSFHQWALNKDSEIGKSMLERGRAGADCRHRQYSCHSTYVYC